MFLKSKPSCSTQDLRPPGLVETPIMTVAPPIGNAIFDATAPVSTIWPMVQMGCHEDKRCTN